MTAHLTLEEGELLSNPRVFASKRAKRTPLQQAVRRIEKGLTKSSQKHEPALRGMAEVNVDGFKAIAKVNADGFNAIAAGQQKINRLLECADSDCDDGSNLDENMTVKQIMAEQRRLKMGITWREIRLRKLADLKAQKIQEQQVALQVTDALRSQARVQEAKVSAAAAHAAEAVAKAKEASKLNDLE